MATILFDTKEIENIKSMNFNDGFINDMDIAEKLAKTFGEAKIKPFYKRTSGDVRIERYRFPFFNCSIIAKVRIVNDELDEIRMGVETYDIRKQDQANC